MIRRPPRYTRTYTLLPCPTFFRSAIPTSPQRKVMLSRAMRSVMAQTLPARAVIVQADNDKEGSAVTRNRALEAVRTPWVAFLDDDDQFLPHHLQRLSQALTETQAYVVYPLPRVLNRDRKSTRTNSSH